MGAHTHFGNGESVGAASRVVRPGIITLGFAVLIFLIVRLAMGPEDAGWIAALGSLGVGLLIIGYFLPDPEEVGNVEVIGLLKVERLKRLEKGLSQVSKAAFRGILGSHERSHLRKLNKQEADIVHYQSGLQTECERLEALGYLQATDKSRGLQALRDEMGNREGFALAKYARITPDGKEYLRLYDQVAPP
ncbi:hypothetical protein AB0F92_22695 [Kitasatospora aureofaciens]|uniref:hypothetical protein n=1 Tax=Kitasatospora aureofaciens TaxID=1894 RepID=UPI0033E36361